MQWLEIRVVASEGAVLGVERNRALEVGYRFGMLTPLSMCHREHVQSVVVVGIFVAHQMQLRDRILVAAAVYGQR